jgi:hypothetical protein
LVSWVHSELSQLTSHLNSTSSQLTDTFLIISWTRIAIIVQHLMLNFLLIKHLINRSNLQFSRLSTMHSYRGITSISGTNFSWLMRNVFSSGFWVIGTHFDTRFVLQHVVEVI